MAGPAFPPPVDAFCIWYEGNPVFANGLVVVGAVARVSCGFVTGLDMVGTPVGIPDADGWDEGYVFLSSLNGCPCVRDGALPRAF